MDFKDFREGLPSLALLIFIFSLTFVMGSILLRPYINLEIEDFIYIKEREFILGNRIRAMI